MLDLWAMQSTASLPSLPGPLWLGEVAPDWVISMGQIEKIVYLCQRELLETDMF